MGLRDTNHTVLTLSLTCLSQCASQPECAAKLRGVVSELAYCLDHSLDYIAEIGSTSGAYAAELCAQLFGRVCLPSDSFLVLPRTLRMCTAG